MMAKCVPATSHDKQTWLHLQWESSYAMEPSQIYNFTNDERFVVPWRQHDELDEILKCCQGQDSMEAPVTEH